MKPLIIFGLLTTLLIQCTSKKELYQWRGPNRDGIYPDTSLLAEWPTDGPKLLWQFDSLGLGYSSPVVANDMIYITGMVDSTGYIYAIDFDGKMLWKKPYSSEWTGSFPGTRSTPLIYDGRGYLLSSFGVVHCFNIETGEMIWERKIFNPKNNDYNQWGLMENFIVENNTLFCTPGDSVDNIFALDVSSGDIKWKTTAKSEINTCNTPIIINWKEKRYYIVSTEKSVCSIDINNGEMVWSYPISNKNKIHANTPIFKEGKLLIMVGFEMGSIMLQVADDGKSVKELWNNPTLDETNGHSVLLGEDLYISAESKGEFRCVDWNTGETKYFIKKYAPGTVISANDMLYCYSYDGEVGLLQPSDTSFIEKGYFKLPKTKVLHIAHPVIDRGRLYIRHDSTLRVYNISANML